MGRIGIVLKRLTKKRMSADDLFYVAGPIIANPPKTHGFAAGLAEQRYSTGKTFLDGWRDELKSCLNECALETSWHLQRLHLVKRYVLGARWMGVYDAVCPGNEKSSVWHAWVENISEFERNPKSAWVSILAKTFMFAALNEYVFIVVGMRCFGLDEATLDLITAYKKLEQHVHKTNIAQNELLRLITEENPEVGQALSDRYVPKLLSTIQESNNMMRGFAEQICAGSVSRKDFSSRWENLANRQNEVLKEIQSATKGLALWGAA